MSQSHCQKTLSELIRSRGRPISKSPVVSEGGSQVVLAEVVLF